MTARHRFAAAFSWILASLLFVFAPTAVAQSTVRDSVRVTWHIHTFDLPPSEGDACGYFLYVTWPNVAERVLDRVVTYSEYRLAATGENGWVTPGLELRAAAWDINLGENTYAYDPQLFSSGGDDQCGERIAQGQATFNGGPRRVNGRLWQRTPWYATYSVPDGTPIAEFEWEQTAALDVSFDGSFESDLSREATAQGRVPVASYEWDFGDGATATAPAPTHTYDTPGTYTVSLTVTDDDGETDTDTQEVEVKGVILEYRVFMPDTLTVGDTLRVYAEITNAGAARADSVTAPQDFLDLPSYAPGDAISYTRNARHGGPRLGQVDTTITDVDPGQTIRIDQEYVITNAATTKSGRFGATWAIPVDWGMTLLNVRGVDENGIAAKVTDLCMDAPCETTHIRPKPLKASLTLSTVDGEVTEAAAGRKRLRREDGRFVTSHRFAQLGQPTRCISGCVDVEVTVEDEDGAPIEGAVVILDASDVGTAGNVTPEQGGGFFCPLLNRPGTCSRSFRTEPTDAEGKVEALYWFPGLVEPATTTIEARATKDLNHVPDTASTPLSLQPTRVDFGHNAVSPSIEDAAFLTVMARIQQGASLAAFVQEKCGEGADKFLTSIAGGKPLDNAWFRSNKAATDWFCSRAQGLALSKNANNKAGKVLGLIGHAKEASKLAQIYWFFRTFNLHDVGLASIVVQSVTPPFIGYESEFVDAVTNSFLDLGSTQWSQGVVTPLTLDIHEVSYAKANGSRVDFVPALHFRLRSTGAGAIDHKALVRAGYTPASWLTEPGVATVTVEAANAGDINLSLTSSTTTGSRTADGSSASDSETVLNVETTNPSASSLFAPGHLLVLDAGSDDQEFVQVAEVLSNSLRLTAPLRKTHPTGTAASRIDSLDAAAPPAPLSLGLSAGRPGAPSAPTLEWSAYGPARSYDVQVSTDSLFTTLVTDVRDHPAPSLPLSPLAEGIPHYWRVRATNLLGTGPWSPRFAFVVGPPRSDALADAQLLSLDTAAEDTTAVLQWTTAATAEPDEATASCASNANSTWLVLTPAESDRFFFSADGFGSAVQLSVWTGTGHPLQEVACAQSSGSLPAEIRLDLTAGTTYYLQLASNEGADGLAAVTAAVDSDPIPVELSSFGSALDADGTTVLTWTTASETNNAGFHVERAVNGTDRFQPVGFVKGKGTTVQTQHYRFVDASLPFAADRLTYRLRQVDLDGTVSISDAVSVEMAPPDALTLHGVFPHPVRQRATLRYELPADEAVRVDVFDVLGRRVQTLVDRRLPAGRQEVVFDAEGLASGVYFMRLTTATATQTQRLVVVR